MTDLCREGHRWRQESLHESVDGKISIPPWRVSGILAGMDNRHLVHVRADALTIAVCEITREIDQHGVHSRRYRPEGGANPLSDFNWIVAVIVVQQHERDVIPILRFPPFLCRRDLCQQEPSKAGHIHIHPPQYTVVVRLQLA